MRTGATLLVLLGAVAVAAAEPDWAPIQYSDGVGCGLFVQFFTASGDEATASGRPTGFFPGGAPPATSEADCLAKCREWAAGSIVRGLAAGYRQSLAVSRVSGTCYLQRQPLGPPLVVGTD